MLFETSNATDLLAGTTALHLALTACLYAHRLRTYFNSRRRKLHLAPRLTPVSMPSTYSASPYSSSSSSSLSPTSDSPTEYSQPQLSAPGKPVLTGVEMALHQARAESLRDLPLLTVFAFAASLRFAGRNAFKPTVDRVAPWLFAAQTVRSLSHLLPVVAAGWRSLRLRRARARALAQLQQRRQQQLELQQQLQREQEEKYGIDSTDARNYINTSAGVTPLSKFDDAGSPRVSSDVEDAISVEQSRLNALVWAERARFGAKTVQYGVAGYWVLRYYNVI